MERSMMIERLSAGGAGESSVLDGFELCRAAEFDVFRDSLNGVFYPAKVEPTGGDGTLRHSRLSATELSHLTLGFVRFGTETALDPGALGAYHVNVALSGAVESLCGTQRVVARPGVAAVFTPREHTYLPRWGADAGQLCIKIDRRALESELEAMIGRPVSSSVRFALGFDLTGPAGRSWLAVVRLLLADLETERSLGRRFTGHREQLERLVISSLLRAQPHDFLEELRDDRRPVRSRTVKRVVDAVDAAPERPWTLTSLAETAGVGGRRLQQGFREQMGMSPMVYLRVVRLERVHRDLAAGVGSVTDVAFRWGFTHPGRFADAYRERFGHAPSETLRRARG
ncbi:AraC family transcriptional regulator [Pseudonocardia sp. WMMC193]|uniref:AraC family transcriptional regulator n=1 Tax=Pseudonocardia sp. WMMC193 TaxID=2911965 RepID=UPI001F30B373|nr:AraC family transcriptional regulator [Pseudonocardia sp. WMMC193]MCF7553638.1 AraC family transcriptional regulator [Pseudonocardia sp. WMMC193]